VKSFCAIPQVLAFLKDYIVFAEKDEELNKYILRQHQTTRGGARAVQPRPRSQCARRGLVWHTQGSGKTFTMIKAAERLFKRARGGQADRAADDRPQRAGRPDAQEPRRAGPGQSWSTPAASARLNQLLKRRLPGHHRVR
jgi:hypothetical protein